MLDWAHFAADVSACTACGLRSHAKQGGARRWRPARRLAVCRRGARGRGGREGRAFRRTGRAPSRQHACRAWNEPASEAVYIANVLKCRPPGNRAPTPLEVESCLPYLDRQIALIQPKLIVALGKSAATTLLHAEATIASLRGRVHRYKGVPLIVTYHPAYLLRNLPDKAKAWEDLCLARTTLRGIMDSGLLQTPGTVTI